jgi:polyhydroxybutyrate depolymerase
MRAAATLVVLSTLALAACGDGGIRSTTLPASTAGPSPTAAPSPTPAHVAPSPTVPQAAVLPVRVTVGDDERVIDLLVPTLPPGKTAPLLILLHAAGESVFAMERETNAAALAERAGAIVALPPARGRGWNVMVAASDPITPSTDIAYVAGLIDRLTDEYPVDPRRVFVAGFSMGAVASGRIACEFADRVTAVALNAGAPWSNECDPVRPVPILVMHGTADRTFDISLADALVARWRELDGCRGAPVVSTLSDIATSEVNADCTAGTSVQYVRYLGSGHRWLQDPNATDVMWSFFAGIPARP